MKNIAAILIAAAILLPAAFAQGQVDTAEILGVDMTRPHSRNLSGWQLDDSVGEARIEVLALDSGGNPVAGAPVVFVVHNSSDNLAYIVGASGRSDFVTRSAYTSGDQVVDGVETDADGRAWLVLDSNTSGDVTVSVTVGGVEAAKYGGGGMRIVWF